MKVIKILALSYALVLAGCASLSPELVRELAKDDASACLSSDVRGGVGSLMTPGGGYGQATLGLCRSAMPNATLTLNPDGSISIHNGK
jgi:hypothetical protein